jgi:sensor histidine kinase YesM
VAAIEQLGELLHASLRDDGREEITVDEEVALVERYLALQGMRFGERLRYACEVAPDAADCLVPILLLQPLVENAVVHGLDAGQESLFVRVAAGVVRDGIEITVENDGTSLRRRVARADGAEGAPGSGHGLGVATTRARLITAHGDLASLTITERTEGGVCARIFIPRARAVQHAGPVELALAVAT